MKRNFTCLLIVLFFVSCNTSNLRVEKRRYNKGFYSAFSQKQEKTKQQNSTIAIENVKEECSHENKRQIVKIDTISEIKFAESYLDGYQKLKKDSNNLITNSDPKEIVTLTAIPQKVVKRDLKIIDLIKGKLNKMVKSKKNHQNANDDTGISKGALAVLILGIVFLSGGTFVLWFVSILFGAIALGIGLVMLIIGAAKLKHSIKNVYSPINTNSSKNLNQTPLQYSTYAGFVIGEFVQFNHDNSINIGRIIQLNSVSATVEVTGKRGKKIEHEVSYYDLKKLEGSK
jgi:hypothetical protein